jgi:two-component system, cell cycle sensor histidine kinase and response regulator CckA
MPVPRLALPIPTGLRKRLLFLVLASVLPFVLLIGIVARRNLLDQKPLAAERALARAQRIADQLDDRLSSIESVMRTAAITLGARRADAAQNDRVLQELAITFGSGFASWRLFDGQGDMIGSSAPDAGAPRREYMVSLWSGRPPGGHALVTEPVNTSWAGQIVHMILPMTAARGDSAFLVAQIRLQSLHPLIHARGLPEGTSIAVLSDSGMVLGRVPNPEQWVGRNMSGFRPFPNSRALWTGTSEATSPDGVRRMMAFAHTRNAPWLVWAGIPMSAVFAQARLDFSRAIGYGALALTLALLLAMRQASRIVDPITRLSDDAARLGTGDLAHRSGVLATDELEVLARTINEMAATLEHQGAVLRESEERYRGLFDINPLPMWVLDPESLEFLAVNGAAVETYGYSEKEFLAMRSSDIRPADDVPNLIAHLAEAGERSRRYVTRQKRKDGTLFPVEIDSGAIVFAGRPARLVVAHDVTDRLHAESALRDAESQLRQSQRLEAIGQLTGGIAHDFNNVLTAIGSYSDFLYDSLEPGDARRLDIQEIRKAAERAAGLTKQLLAFSRSQILQPRVLNINTALSELELLLARLLTADVKLIFSLDPEAGNVRADPGQLAQVVMNLAVNARDAMPDGGQLTISSRNEHVPEPADDAVDAIAVKPGEYVVIEVADTGIGMDSDTQQRIFEPFFTTKGPGKGTGLGLSTVYGIVQQSGGYVFCDSEPGRGTTFTIRLPRVHQPVDPDTVKPERAVAGRRSEVVLIVEDEESVRRAARRILVKKGYTVLEASDGNDAVELLNAQSKVDLLLTDLVMPGMGGRELVRVLRDQGRSIPTLYMSGYTKDAIMREELDPDIMVLEKPFSHDELAAKVREVLDQNGHA